MCDFRVKYTQDQCEINIGTFFTTVIRIVSMDSRFSSSLYFLWSQMTDSSLSPLLHCSESPRDLQGVYQTDCKARHCRACSEGQAALWNDHSRRVSCPKSAIYARGDANRGQCRGESDLCFAYARDRSKSRP